MNDTTASVDYLNLLYYRFNVRNAFCCFQKRCLSDRFVCLRFIAVMFLTKTCTIFCTSVLYINNAGRVTGVWTELGGRGYSLNHPNVY